MRRLSALTCALALATACGYQSSYAPPDGWRARPVYSGNEIEWVGARQVPRCAAEVEAEEVSGWTAPPPMSLDAQGRWVRGGVHVHLWHVGPHPHLHPVYPAYGFIPNPPGPHRLFLPGFGAPRGGRGSWMPRGGSSSSGGGKGAGMVAALALAIVVVASSGIAIGLAADPPEDDNVAGSIDSINRFNDDARRKIAACYEAARVEAAASEAARARETSADEEVGP